MSLFNLDANIASHVITKKPIPDNEYRIVILGDSSTWGTLLKPEETLAGKLNQLDLITPDGKDIKAYNLGYPTMSLTKDLIFLNLALDFQPDLVIWLVTLESFPNDKQMVSPIVSYNKEAVVQLINDFDLDLDIDDNAFQQTDYWNTTLLGQRRNIADIFRLQFYGIMWGITHIDQYYPIDYELAKRDFEEDTSFYDWDEGEMKNDDLAFNLLQAGQDMVGEIPIILVNEPILISDGRNSDIRYNFYYPVWAYDQYRKTLAEISSANNWIYLDLWDLIPESEFTNTAIHFTPTGMESLTGVIAETVIEIVTRPKK
jgi:hypothetical protein